jgi:tetratricopeptide (TPR) repeat protein
VTPILSVQNPSVFLARVARASLLALAVSAPFAALADEYTDVNRLVQAKQFDQAMARADQYLAAKPRDPQMRFLKGVIQTEAGRTADAIATFTRLTEDYPELPEPYNNLAVLYAAQSQFDKARAALEMAVRTNPSYAVAYENLGDVYARLAAQSYAKAVQLDASTSASVTPKLTLIRSMFSNAAKGQKSAAATPAAAASAPVAAASAPAAAKTSPSKKP